MIQRRKRTDDGKFYVGGEAVLTNATRHGVTQRVVHTWPADKIGKPTVPEPIDLLAWRAERSGVRLSDLSVAATTITEESEEADIAGDSRVNAARMGAPRPVVSRSLSAGPHGVLGDRPLSRLSPC